MSAEPLGLTVRHDSLLSSGSDLRTVATDVLRRLEELSALAESLTGVGGGDDISGLIGEGYRAVHAMAVESISSAAESLARDGDGVLVMRANYTAADQEAERITGRLKAV
ncbi:hypothetical protein [Streptosporangium saharense]|uniref:hypothetical protein n=1 Tax=Streptosporangium saharense TaxID=1706840 RepID=UPI00342B0D08